MAFIVTGDVNSSSKADFSGVNYDYEYPGGLDLKPGSDFHNRLKNTIWQKARESNSEMSNRYDSWNEVDRVLTVYIAATDAEKVIQEKDDAKPVSIVFPYSYSILESLLTYLTMAFFQDPLFKYEGVGPEDIRGAMLMEQVIRLHCIKTKVPLAIHTVLRDSLAYGIGIGVPGWEVKYGRKKVQSTTISESEAGIIENNDSDFVDSMLFEGNKLSSVSPYMFLPDPSVSAHDIQSGEFVGWMVRDNLMNLLSEEGSGHSRLFNVKYLKGLKERRSTLAIDQSDRNLKSRGGGDIRDALSETNPVDVIYMYVNLIPADNELGRNEYPEKWLFGLASDEVIVSAERIDYAHNMYPVGVAAPEFDGYSITPLSRLEVLYGLQHTLNWLFNSHIANVRKAINDMLVVDPYLVNINDLKDPKPGKLIRLRRPAWGRGVDKVVQQLAVNDVTRQNISDTLYVMQYMDKIGGADQSMMGALRQSGPERLTGVEFQGTRTSAVTRLQRIAMIIGMQFMQDIGYMFASHAQQFMSKETYISIIGQNADQLRSIFGDRQRVPVSPYDISVDYDVVVKDGSVPGGNFSSAWIDIFKIIAAQPELYQQFDLTRIFMYIATQLGAKNVEDFRRNVNNMQVNQMPDELAMREAERGNIVPIGAGGIQ